MLIFIQQLKKKVVLENNTTGFLDKTLFKIDNRLRNNTKRLFKSVLRCFG